MVQQACIIALHEIFSEPQETSFDFPITNSIALLAADKRCVMVKPLSSPVKHENSGQHGELAVENQPALSSDQQLHSTDVNNNSGRDRGSESFIRSDSNACHPATDDSCVVAVASAGSIGTLTEDGRTSSFYDVETSQSCPFVADSEQCQQNDENTCDVLVDELSDMSIDVDDDDLEGAGYIFLDVEASEVPDGTGNHCGKESSCGISVAETEVVLMRDEEPPRKVQIIAETISSDARMQSSSARSSDVSSGSQSTSGSSRNSGASTGSYSTSETSNFESQSTTSRLSCSRNTSTNSHSPSETSISYTCRSNLTNSSDGGNLASGSHITRPSPTPGTAAVSIRQMPTGTTKDGFIRFAESASISGKPSSADASLKSSRLAERSSLADRSNARMHPYRAVQKTNSRRQQSRCHFSFKKYDTYKNVQDLLECHSAHMYRLHPRAERQANPRVLVEVVRRNEKPAFISYKFVRATRSAARKILGETNVVDDLEDIPITAGDIKHFDEKKRMAEELDRAFGSYLDDNSRY